MGETARARAAQIPLWVSQATGDQIIPIDDSWLEDIDEASADMPAPSVDDLTAVDEPATPQRKRRGFFGRRKKSKDVVSDDPTDFEDELASMQDDDAGDDMEDLRSGLLS